MKKLVAFLVIINVVFVSIYVYDKLNASKTAYVIIQDVFNAFELKKDYERKLTATKSSRQKIVDSLEMELKLLGKKIESENGKNKDEINVFTVKRDNFFQKKKLFEEDNAMQTKKYDEEIIIQMNQYIKDFGNNKGYTYIYGNDGTGSLMYAHENKNITKEIIEYVNEKYRGQ